MRTTILFLLAIASGGCTADLEPNFEVSPEQDFEPDPDSIEQTLGLFPRQLTANELAEPILLDMQQPAYVVLSVDAGEIRLDALHLTEDGERLVAADRLFEGAASVVQGVLHRDALLLVSVPAEHADELCERFQLSHEQEDLLITEDATVFTVPHGEGAVHALCLMPAPAPEPAEEDDDDDGISEVAAPADPYYGAGAHTLHIKTVKVWDPRDWENWPYDGDEARLEGYYDGWGGAHVWTANNVKSGNFYAPQRFIHYNNAAKMVLYDADGGINNADKLGENWIYTDAACSGDRVAHFDGSGGGHSWNYDLTYRVYGPNCPCQSQVTPVHSPVNSVVSTVLSSTITNYSYYCVGGIRYSQAWGNIVRRDVTYQRTYNTSCEMSTFVSETVISDCNHYLNGVAIGGAVMVGNCPVGGGGLIPDYPDME